MICPYSDRCGACEFQHVPYNVELGEKEDYVRRLLGRYGKVAPIIPAESRTGYRNKCNATFAFLDGRTVSGTYASESHYLVPVKSCRVNHPLADRIIREFTAIADFLRIPCYNEDLHTGVLRHIQVRIGEPDKAMVTIVSAYPDIPKRKELVSLLVKRCPEVKTVVLHVNREHTGMILLQDGSFSVLYGPGYITDTLLGTTFRVSSTSFYQVNRAQAEKLYSIALKMARIRPEDTVIDAYCGTGTITLLAAKQGPKSVIGIETNPEAVQDARTNADANAVSNVSFICADAAKELKARAKAKETADIILLDPPRAGSSEEFLAAASRLSPRSIVYISCNPETLERDIRYLTRLTPYRVIGFQPVDMFPLTSHVETVVCLRGEKVDGHINIDLDVNKLAIPFTNVTYDKIRGFVRDKYGFDVSSLYIAQIKEKVGIKERKNYNTGSGEGKVSICPKEKEDAIMDAFKHFGLA